MKETIQNENSASQFSKAELAAADKFRSQRDLLAALLQDERKYSLNEVNTLIDNFMNGRVK